jgi:phosphate transport system substrate-binding protein
MRVSILITAVAGAALTAAACGDVSTSSSAATSSGGAATPTTTPVAECVQGSIKADGSSAIKALVQKAADGYQAKCTGATISVAATNSSTGVTKASTGAVDVGDSDIPASLVQGVDPTSVVDHQVAIVLFAVVVNPDAGVSNLSSAQIKDIFTGTVSNWSQVGGANLPISVIERKPGSGTRLTFDKDLMAGTPETSSPSQVLDTTQTVLAAFGSAKGAVSYVTSSATAGTNLVAVSIDNNKPSADTVKNGSYPFFSHEHCFTGASPSQLALSFIQYMQTPAFQSGVLTKAGYLPLTTTDKLAAVDK